MKTRSIAIPALLFLLLAVTGCVKLGENDIRGVWTFRAGDETLFKFLFTGSRAKGTLVETASPADGAGSYTVDGTEVEFEFVSLKVGGRGCHFRGAFVDGDTLAGKMDLVAPYPPFAWTVDAEGLRL